MIRAEDFVEPAARLGYRWYTGVPCSFLTPFINYAGTDHGLHYLSAANEGDALAAAAGAVLGGRRAVVMMQNSGLGNAVNPLTSLTHVFRIPVLLIITLRGDPELHDEPQHELMGQVTGKMLEMLSVPWEYFPTSSDEIEPALQRAEAYIRLEQRPYAFIMRKGSVAPYALPAGRQVPSRPAGSDPLRRYSFAPDARHSRMDALRHIVALTPERGTVLIATTGYTGRELCTLADRPNQLYMVGSMGCASSLGLGLSLARPDLRVAVIDGDGAALMRMGNFATIGAYGRANLAHILLDNEAHDSTGAQETVSAGVSFARIAAACGYAFSSEGDDPGLLDETLAESKDDGPRFLQLKIRCGTLPDLPRPGLSPAQVRARLMAHIGAPQELFHGSTS